MTRLTQRESAQLVGGGFWGGLACGLALTSAFVSVTSPDPFSKIALLTYGGGLIGCANAF